jgi:hypothetical protein
MRLLLIALTVALVPGSYLLVAQQPAQQPPAGGGQGRGGAPGAPGGAPGGGARGPVQPMSFFITSYGNGDGANLGGLAGADAHCQLLAAAAGRGGVTWHAYLSTQGPNAVNARDRIGNGPWYNARGQIVAQNVAALHGDTIDQARLGNPLGKQISLTEKGELVNGVGDMPNQHDMLTGSQTDGRGYADAADHTCNNWTSSENVAAPARGAAPAGGGAPPAPAAPPAPGPSAQLGHSDKQGGNNSTWNSSHPSRGCSQPNLVATGGAGLYYCFAVN